MLRIPVNNCCGCTACASACPRDAISMVLDSEGFAYPRINAQACVSCGLCEKACPILFPPKCPEKYEYCAVTQSSREDVLDSCTSGGFIDAVYQYVLQDLGGYAAGVAFGEDFVPTHMIADSYEKAAAFRNSKYAQSSLDGVFRGIRTLLKKGANVLFVGTPCQTAGLKAFLAKDWDNLITVDLVCRSIPSQKLWKEYLRWQEGRFRSKVKRVSFRRKTYGYHSGALEMEFENGRIYRGSNRVDYFMKSFHHDICSRPSCYSCSFKTKHRCSDFTVFDSWQPQMVAAESMEDNNLGYSNVLVHTPKGKEILHRIKDQKILPADPEKMFLYAGGMESKSISYPKVRETFYRDLNQLGFEKTVKKYIAVSALDHLIERMKPLYYRIRKLGK